MSCPQLTVVVTAYNYGRYLSKCLESILTQDFTDFELIILDNCSTDDTAAVIRKYSHDKRLRHIRHEKNLGACINFGVALKQGSGRFLTIVSADDYLLPGHFSKLIEMLSRHPECVLAYTPICLVDDKDQINSVQQHIGYRKESYTGGRNDFIDLLRFDCYVTLVSVVFNREKLSGDLYFDLTTWGGSDWELFVRLAAKYNDFAFDKEATACYRIHDTQYSNTNFYASIEPLYTHLNILERHLNKIGNRDRLHFGPSIAYLLKQRMRAYQVMQYEHILPRLQRVLTYLDSGVHWSGLHQKPLLVVIDAMQCQSALGGTLEGISNQLAFEWECVVIVAQTDDINLAEINVFGTKFPNSKTRFMLLGDKSLAEARNRAIAESDAEFILSLKSGDRLSDEVINKAISYLRQYSEVEMISLKEDQVASSADLTTKDIVTSARWLYSRNLFDRLNGYSSAMLFGGEESEFALRALQADTQGLQIGCAVSNTEISCNDSSQLMLIAAMMTFLNPRSFPAARLIEATLALLAQHERWAIPITKALERNPADAHPYFLTLVLPKREQVVVDVPFFTIILTTFNRPALLLDALASLEVQTCRDFEVILVNDHGVPVEHLIGNYTFPITYLFLGQNSGLSAARNAGLKVARGRYITYLDDDDFYLPDHLAVLRQQFEKTPQALVYTDSITVQEDVIDGVRYPLGGQNLYAHQGFSRDRLLVQNYIPVNTWSHPAELISQVGGFDVSLPSFEDWDMLLRLTERTDVIHIEQVTAEVRQRRQRSSDQMTSQNRAKFPILYRRIYGRYPVEQAEIKAQRQAQLDALEMPPQPTVEEVYREFLGKRKLNQAELDAYADSLRGYALPQFTVVITDSELNDQALIPSLKSIAAQYYHQHQVWVVSARDATPANSEQIRWLKWGELDAAIAALPADGLVGVFTAGDTFEQHALLLLAHQHLTQTKSLLYFDADQIDATGRCHSPQFRAQFDAVLQLGTAYLGRSLIVPSDVLQSLALDTQLLQAPHLGWWQLVVLSVFLQHGAKAIVHLPFVLHHQARVLEADADYSQLLLQDYYKLRNKLGQPLSHNGVHRIVAQSLDSQTLIAIEAGLESERLLTSIENLLTGIAGLPAVVVVLDRGADAVTPAVQALSDIAHPQLQILSCPAEFEVLTWLRSMASPLEWLAYIAGDVCINQPECMPMLLSTMAMNDAHWVAPRLVDGHGRNMGAPLVAGFDDGVKSPLQALPVAEVGYQQRNQALQQSLLLDPRCVLMHRDVLFADVLSGAATWSLQLIELQLASFYNGGMALWEPVAVASADIRFALELNDVASLIPHYRDLFANDPFYSPNFQRTGQFLLERNRLAGPDLLAWSQLPKVLVFPADEFGCGYYRLIHPYHVMEQAGLIRGGVGFEHFSVCDLQRMKPDLILVQRQISPEQITSLARYKAWANCPIVFELDDYILNLPVKSLHRDEMPQGMAASLRKALSFCDRLVVSTQPLAQALKGYHADIRVAANRLPLSWWSFAAAPKLPGEGKPRVGWAGGVGHTGDLLLVADVVAELANEVDWVFFGYCPEVLQPYVKEFHPGVEITQYPAKLASLNLDLVIAPLEENLFNSCKSNLKLLEYGACAYPVVCSDFGPYQGEMPVVRVKNRFKDWVDAIRLMLRNHELRLQMAQRLHDEVRANWMLDEAAAVAWCRDWFGR